MLEKDLNLLIEEWFSSSIKDKVKKSTYCMYLYRVKKYICPLFTGYEGCHTKLDIEIFLSSLRNEKTKECLSFSTKKGIFFLLNEFYDYLKCKKIVNNNPCDEIKLKKTGRKHIKLLNEKEQNKLIDYLVKENSSRSVLVLTGLFTGMRIGELCALTYSNLDLNGKKIIVQKTKQRIAIENCNAKTCIIMDSPKTACSDRVIPISNFLVKLLKQLLNQGRSQEGYVFCKKDGASYDVRSIQKYFSVTSKKLEIRINNFHSVRHTFATRAIETGVDVKSLSIILGHANVTTTMNFYVHPNEKHMRNKIEKISNYFVKNM